MDIQKPKIRIENRNGQYFWIITVFGCEFNWGLVRTKSINSVIQESIDQFVVIGEQVVS